jgi:hypothetical protein
MKTAFKVIAPKNEGTLFKSVLTRISGEPTTAVANGNLENWEKLKEFLKNTYTERQILDYHANLLFSTKQIMLKVYHSGYSVCRSWVQNFE